MYALLRILLCVSSTVLEAGSGCKAFSSRGGGCLTGLDISGRAVSVLPMVTNRHSRVSAKREKAPPTVGVRMDRQKRGGAHVCERFTVSK